MLSIPAWRTRSHTLAWWLGSRHADQYLTVTTTVNNRATREVKFYFAW